MNKTEISISKQFFPNRIIPSFIKTENRAVVTVREHVIAQESLAGGGEGVSVEESAKHGVIIAALQIVEAGVGNAVLSSVAKEVDFDSRGNRDLSQELI